MPGGRDAGNGAAHSHGLVEATKKEDTMKRFMLLLALLISCLLSGCGNTPNGASSSATVSDPGDTTSSTGEPLIELIDAIPLHATTEQGYYYSEEDYTDLSARLMYVDFATHTQFPLCAQPNCTHDTVSCPAYFPHDAGNLKPFCIGDRPYILHISDHSNEGGAPGYVEAMTADGQERTELFRLKNGQVFDMSGVVLGNRGGLIFGIIETKTDTAQTSHLICRYDFARQKLDVLAQEKEEISIAGAIGSDILVKQYIQSEGMDTYYLEWYLLDQEGNRRELDIESWPPEGRHNVIYRDGKLYTYLLEKGEVYCTDMEAGSTELLFADERLSAAELGLFEDCWDGGLVLSMRHTGEQEMAYFLLKDGQLTRSQYDYRYSGDPERKSNLILADLGEDYLVSRDLEADTFAIVNKDAFWQDAGTESDEPIERIS